jgi:hypothetical protein
MEQDDFKVIQNIMDENRILGHKYSLVREIIYSSALNILISLGDDNRIYIRNETFYELLTCIDLSLYLNKNILNYDRNRPIDCNKDFICGNKILLNHYDTLYYINSYSGFIISFTLNGLKISKRQLIDSKDNNSEKTISSYLINIYDDFRFLYCKNNKIVEYNPVNLNEIFFEYNIDLKKCIDNTNNNNTKEIKAIFYNNKNKCFDLWIKINNRFEIVKYDIIEKFDNIDIKKIIINRDDNTINSSKKLKMERFAQKKGLFKTITTLSARNAENKSTFQ